MIAKTWLYLSVGSIMLSFSSLLFLFYYVLGSDLLRRTGGMIMALAGLLLLLGLRAEYIQWHRLKKGCSKDLGD